MDQKGYLVCLMERIFGLSWRTSLFGILAFLTEASNLIIQYLTEMNVEPKILHSISAIFALVALLRAKDGQVTGGTIVQESSPKAVAAMQVAPADAPGKNDSVKCDPPK